MHAFIRLEPFRGIVRCHSTILVILSHPVRQGQVRGVRKMLEPVHCRCTNASRNVDHLKRSEDRVSLHTFSHCIPQSLPLLVPSELRSALQVVCWIAEMVVHKQRAPCCPEFDCNWLTMFQGYDHVVAKQPYCDCPAGCQSC